MRESASRYSPGTGVHRSARIILAAGVLALGAQSASALVLTSGSPEQKWRADVRKQAGKLIACVVKATLKCEAAGPAYGLDCDPAVPSAAYEDGGKFVAAIEKCESKVDYAKKGDFYLESGCIGDAVADDTSVPIDTTTLGDQIYADLAAYEEGSFAAVEGAVSLIGSALPALTGCKTTSEATPVTPGEIVCANAQAAALGAYASGWSACADACENDYKNSKGNGGPTDAPSCIYGDAGASAAFTACIDAARAKAYAKVTMAPVVGLVAVPLFGQVLNAATNETYNDPNSCD